MNNLLIVRFIQIEENDFGWFDPLTIYKNK